MAVTSIITLLGLFGFLPGTYTANSDGALIERVEALEKRLQLSEGSIFTLQETIQRKEETINMLQSNLQQTDTSDNNLVLHQQQFQLDKLTVKLQQQQEQLDKHSLIIQQQQMQLDQQNQKIQQQQEQIDQQNQKIQQQQEQIDQQNHHLQQQEERILNLEAELEKCTLDVSNDELGENNQSISGINDVPNSHGNNTNRTVKAKQSSGISRRQRQVEGGGIAFTAYLDHDVELGTDQIIQFNQVITNEAEAYSVHTGVFTCPESGLYMFSFSVGERDSGQIWADLRVNSALKTSATAETKATSEDNQGSSTVVIRLTIGDKVWVSGRDNQHIEGNAGFRVTTFTGVYLYP